MAENSDSGSNVARYTVQSSDVISDMRVNVSEEGTDRVVWYKERFLGDEEIIENVVENATSTIQWTVHRPSRGWYIRIRSPSFPPGVFINLAPLPKSSPYHTDSALTFACRTNSPAAYTVVPESNVASSSTLSLDSDVTLTDYTPRDSSHSYPPISPQLSPRASQTMSPRIAEAAFQASRSPRSSRQSLFVAGRVTNFLLTPHSAPHVPHQPETTSIFTRMFSALKNNAPSHSASFTLSPIPSAAVANIPENEVAAPLPIPQPLLAFHDRTPVWTVRSTTGIIELDTKYIQSLGVDTSFYIACALTYLEFLSEREGYLAAVTD
ncbi:hypothetical protein C8Q75DRAFT_870928 [Abortiporus biennis]|nr:hypothetical protein C8Q75DRAFT_870928 [Abortiporus biennis]